MMQKKHNTDTTLSHESDMISCENYRPCSICITAMAIRSNLLLKECLNPERIIKADKSPVGEHERRFNAPVMSEVATLIVGQKLEKRDIILEKRNSRLLRIRETHRAYDSLQYPSIFWEGHGRCTKEFPKKLKREIQSGENDYPKYRRSPDDGGFKATIRQENQGKKTVDNKWMVSYSPLLCKAFSANINAKYYNSIKPINCMCKYINKGTNQAVFTLPSSERDEIADYQHGCYIWSSEALWRIFSFPIHERYPTLVHLNIK